MLLFGVVRRLPRTWWIWGAVVTILFSIFIALIAPVYIVPIFNKYTRLDDPKIVDPILSLARTNGIPAKDVYPMDAPRQTTRISANVSGFANTMRITLNDNLLRRGSPEESQAVMGHEMGHYVLNHVYKGFMFDAMSTVVLFAYLCCGLDWTLSAGAKNGRFEASAIRPWFRSCSSSPPFPVLSALPSIIPSAALRNTKPI